ncbi:lamin tail domain-containing protein, partial [bacterium]|nr:lamin tail domain-containing protein [bacterium]
IQVNSSTGSGPTLLINEVAFETGGGGFDEDWVEIYCVDDGNNGNGANIESYYIDDLDGTTTDKTFGLLVIKTGEYLLVHYDDSLSTDETERSGDAINVYTADTGVTGSDEELTIFSNTGAILDAVAWSNDPLADVTDVDILVAANQWTKQYADPLVSEWEDCVDSGVIGTGNSIIRDKNSTDTNDKQDWTKTTIPTPGENNASGPSANAKFLINEVALTSSSNDWIEVYCVDDANFGNGSEVSGYYFKDDSKIKTIADGTKIRTGEFILLTFNSDSTDETVSTNGILKLYTTDGGMTGTDEQAIFSNHLDTILDAVCWSNYDGEIVASELTDIQELVDVHEWMTSAAESTCVDITNVIDTGSIYRARSKQDTDLKSDWFISVKPTPGTYNADAGEAVKIKFEVTATEYHSINLEKEITIQLLDPFDSLAVNSVVSANIYSNSHSAKFSKDSGITWNQDIEVTFMKGTAKVRLKKTAIENVTLTVISRSASVQDAIKDIIFIREPPVVITEIMFNPGEVDDSDGEWVELYNRSTGVVELKNWTITTGTSKTTISEGVKLNPGEYMVVAAELVDGTDTDTDSFASLYGDKNGVWDEALDGFKAIDGSISMSDDSSVILESPEGHKIEFVYEDELGGDGNNHSLEKMDFDIIDRGELDIDRYNWGASSFEWGTPGKVNSNVPAGLPTNMIVNHTAVTLATLGEPIYIVAEVKSAQSVTSAKMYYKRENESSYHEQDMVKILGTNLYQGIIPDEFLDSESILYYLEIKDTDETVLSPTDGSDGPNKIAIVDMVPKLKIVPDYKGVTAGEVFDVEIRLENAIELVGASFEVSYDSTAFERVDQNENRLGDQLKIGSFMSAGFAEVNQADGGLIQFSISGLKDEVTGDGVIAIAKFKILTATAQKYEFKFLTALVTNDDDENTVPAMFNGQIEYGTVSSDLVGPKGAVISGPNEMTLSIPEKALKSVQRIGIERLVSGDANLPSFAEILMSDDNIVSVGIAYWIQPDSLRFYKASEFVFPFSSDDLEAVGLTTDDETYLTLYRYKREEGIWEKAGGKVDRTANTVTLQMMQGGVYLLVNDPTKAPSFFIKNLYATINPFSPNGNGINDTTEIRFDISDDSEVTLRIFNTRGKLMRMLAQEEDYSSGLTGIEWDGKDDDGNLLKTGIYIIHIYAKDDYDRKAKHGKTVVISNHMFE